MMFIAWDVVAAPTILHLFFIKFPITKYSANTPEVGRDASDEYKWDASR